MIGTEIEECGDMRVDSVVERAIDQGFRRAERMLAVDASIEVFAATRRATSSESCASNSNSDAAVPGSEAQTFAFEDMSVS